MRVRDIRERAGYGLGHGTQPSDPFRAPVEYRDAVELWARTTGKHATLEWCPTYGCYAVFVTLKDGHPLLRMYQLGKLPKEPKESILLRRQLTPEKWEALKLDELGVSGLVSRLEQADMMTGQGQFTSLAAAMNAQERHNQNLRELMRRTVRENCADIGRDIDRLYTPKQFVPDNLEETNATCSKETAGSDR